MSKRVSPEEDTRATPPRKQARYAYAGPWRPGHPDPDEYDYSVPPPPMLARLDDVLDRGVPLDIREGQWTAGDGPRPYPTGDPTTVRPGTYKDIDKDRYYPSETGYIVDRATGKFLPGEKDLMPYHPWLLRLQEEAVAAWHGRKDIRFAEYRAGVNGEAVTEFIQLDAGEERARAESRLRANEELKQKLVLSGASSLIKENATVSEELAHAGRELDFVETNIVEGSRRLLDDHGLGTWLYVLPKDGSTLPPCAGLLMPYEWREQYQLLLREVVYPSQAGTPGVSNAYLETFKRIIRQDKAWFGTKWTGWPAFSVLDDILTNYQATAVWQWRLAALLYVLERDVWQRVDTGIGLNMAPCRVADRNHAPIGSLELQSIQTQGQWLSAVLLYQLRKAMEALPGIRPGQPLYAAIDLARPHDDAVANGFRYPDEESRGEDIPDSYPVLLAGDTVPSNVQTEGSLITDEAGERVMYMGRLDAFARLFRPLLPLPVPPPPVIAPVFPGNFSIYVTMIDSGAGTILPVTFDNVVRRDLTGHGGLDTWLNSALATTMDKLGLTPRNNTVAIQEQVAEDIVLAIAKQLQDQGHFLCTKPRDTLVYSHIPTVNDYDKACVLLDASRSPLLEQFYSWFAPASSKGEIPFAFDLPTQRELLLETTGSVKLGANNALSGQLATMLPGTMHGILAKLWSPLARIDVITGHPFAMTMNSTVQLPGEFNPNKNVVTHLYPRMLGAVFNPLSFPTVSVTETHPMTVAMATEVVLPIGLRLLADATQQWLQPHIGGTRLLRLGLSTNAPYTSLPLEVRANAPTVPLPVPVPDTTVDGKKDKKEKANELVAARSALARMHDDLLSHLQRSLNKDRAREYLHKSVRLLGMGLSDLFDPSTEEAGMHEFLLHEQMLTPWATVALFLDLLHWTFGQDNTFRQRVSDWETTSRDVQAKLQARLGLDLSQENTLAELLRLDTTPSPGYMMRPEISGMAYFTPKFIAEMRMGMAFVRRNAPRAHVTLDDLTDLDVWPDLAAAFGMYLGALAGQRSLVHPRQYKTQKEYGYVSISLQAAEHELLNQIAQRQRGSGRATPGPVTTGWSWG